MKTLLYFPCHTTMECNELEIFTSLGFSCVSVGHFLTEDVVIKRPELEWTLHAWRKPTFNRNIFLTDLFLKLNPGFCGYAPYQKFNLPKQYLKGFDKIVISNTFGHLEDVIGKGCPYPNQQLIWCSVGQTNNITDSRLCELQNYCKLVNRTYFTAVRCAVSERRLNCFCNKNTYYTSGNVDPSFLNVEWIGDIPQIISISRAIVKRANTDMSLLKEMTKDLPYTIYGKGNEDLVDIYSGGELTFPELIQCYQNNRVFLNCVAGAAPLTYTFVEAMAIGIPVVTLGQNLAYSIYEKIYGPNSNLYYMDKYIDNGVNGFVSDDIKEINHYCKILLNDYKLAKYISDNARKFARDTWSFDKVKSNWSTIFANKQRIYYL